MATENPLESIHDTIAFDSKDWSLSAREAWIYGIVCGWDEDSFKELAEQHEWEPACIKRLKRLHGVYNKLKDSQQPAAPISNPSSQTP